LPPVQATPISPLLLVCLYQAFLAELLLAECVDRDRRSSIRRVKAANFPRDNWPGDSDFDAYPNVNPATTQTLATRDWIRKGAPLCAISAR
jgi:IstB-like ATP binding protein